MWHAAKIAEELRLYAPDYGFSTTVEKFDWRTLIESRSAYIDRMHQSYEQALYNNYIKCHSRLR